MSDAIADLGYCAAACELESRLCPWDRIELEGRATAYRGEQLRLLGLLLQPVELECEAAGAPVKPSRGSRCQASQVVAGGSETTQPISAVPARRLRGRRRVSRKM